jgi:hypothetical protein
VNASPAKPRAIIAQVEGSGTTASLMLAFDWPPQKRLEVEQRELKDFLARLRFARDRAEFDQFMTERRNRPFEPDSQNQPPTQPCEV